MTTTPPVPRRSSRRVLAALSLAFAATAPVLRAQTGDQVDPVLLERVRDEATARSRVMETVSWLTDVHGPRLTGSPQTKAAAEWAVKTMQEWGLARVALERWGPFGRGWSNERFALAVTAPQRYPVIAYPSAWTPGTNGAVTAAAVLVQIDSAPEFARYRGRLRGSFVLVGEPREVPARFTPQAARYTDAQLDSIARLPLPSPRPRPKLEQLALATAQLREIALSVQRHRFFAQEGVAAVLLQGLGDDGTVFVSGVGGSPDPGGEPPVPTVVLAAEHYGRIARTLANRVPVTLTLDAANRFHGADLDSFNVVAEIPGSDPKLRDEIVMLGAHFDSWHAGTGATDNAAGVAVMMEAMRVLKAARVPLRRTVRVALWTGEEQGLLGSRAYVKEHFGDRETMLMKPAHAKLSAYFNLDNGTGKIRGVYQQGNAAVGPVFRA